MLKQTVLSREFQLESIMIALAVAFTMAVTLFENAAQQYMAFFIPDLIMCELGLLLCTLNNADKKAFWAVVSLQRLGVMIHCIIGTELTNFFIINALALVFASSGLMMTEYIRYACQKHLRRTVIALATADALIIIAVLIFGSSIGGTKAWISVFGISLQLTEFIKLIYLLFAAVIISSYRQSKQSYLMLTVFSAVNLIALAVLNEFGTAIIILIVYLCTVWIYYPRKSFLISAAAITLIAGVFAVLDLSVCGYIDSSEDIPAFVMTFYEKVLVKINTRIKLWVAPAELGYDSSYQLIKAREALTQGGLFGSELKNPVYVPVMESDFVFPALVLNLGVATGIAAVAVYVFLLIRFLRRSVTTHRWFDSVCVFAGGSLIVVPSLIMILGSVCAFPLTGVPAAFLSAGGTQTAVNTTLAALALCFSSPNRVSSALIKRAAEHRQLSHIRRTNERRKKYDKKKPL